MKILGIDSSIPQGSVALLENEHLLGQANIKENSTYSDQILRLVDRVLEESETDLEAVDGFCLTLGPGSFTGLRVGVSLLKGLVLATEKPFVGVDTLEAVALLGSPTENQICAILDARKKELYSARFRLNGEALERLSPDRAIRPEQLCREIIEPTVFVGSGLDTYGDFLASRLGKFFLTPPEKNVLTVAACAIRLIEKRFDAEKCFDLGALNIKYVRKSEAELKFAGTD
ncbi:MAG: tRNA (adenosine(37)-N6)-threonylcarbamoyltransferase complex dimerization subunit type 1 TsaB [Nitrospinae bacterium]|nr:tRNA (adenosine(37)-N6)-threonylcarbamoyltransferase complex dimerization subunit type 1 TsaB [Nitrospinota bacterium]